MMEAQTDRADLVYRIENPDTDCIHADDSRHHENTCYLCGGTDRITAPTAPECLAVLAAETVECPKCFGQSPMSSMELVGVSGSEGPMYDCSNCNTTGKVPLIPGLRVEEDGHPYCEREVRCIGYYNADVGNCHGLGYTLPSAEVAVVRVMEWARGTDIYAHGDITMVFLRAVGQEVVIGKSESLVLAILYAAVLAQGGE